MNEVNILLTAQRIFQFISTFRFCSFCQTKQLSCLLSIEGRTEKMSALRNFTFSILFYVLLLFQGILSTPANIPLSSISDLLIESALISINVHSPHHRVFKKAELISAQKTVSHKLF